MRISRIIFGVDSAAPPSPSDSIQLGNALGPTPSRPARLTFEEPAGVPVMRVLVGGTWVKAIPYVLTGGTWTRAVPYTLTGGSWVTTGETDT